MNRDIALSSLNAGELIALVKSLQQQLIEKDQEIERLTRLLPNETKPGLTKKSASDSFAEAMPGSVEDLLAQLEQIYPEHK